MQRFYYSILFLLIMLTTMACVTTKDNSSNQKPEQIDESNLNNECPSPLEENKGPLHLGSKLSMEGPVAEFYTLYNIYFSLSGTVPVQTNYRKSQGTKWQVNSLNFETPVIFERALLSSPRDIHKWWYFLVEGDGFLRVYEFLVDENWSLIELRFKENETIKKYCPIVVESFQEFKPISSYRDHFVRMEKINMGNGEIHADLIVMDSKRIWLNNSVPGELIQSESRENDKILLKAFVIEVKKDYRSIMNSL